MVTLAFSVLAVHSNYHIWIFPLGRWWKGLNWNDFQFLGTKIGVQNKCGLKWKMTKKIFLPKCKMNKIMKSIGYNAS